MNHPMQQRSWKSALVLSGLALAAAAMAQSAPRKSFAYHWGVTGPEEKSINIDALPIRRDVIMVYQHEFGLYPRFYNGKPENGGVPQKADIPAHLARLVTDIDRFIPNRDFDGCIIIDYEGWDPLWDVSRDEYKALSRRLARERHPTRPESEVERLARAGFESAGRTFLEETLRACKAARPRAKWGYYGIPWPHHRTPTNRLDWLWKACDVFYPDSYMVYQGVEDGAPLGPGQKPRSYYKGGVQVSVGFAREIAGAKPVLAMIWCRYSELNKVHGEKMLEAADLRAMLLEPYLAGADGAIFWDAILKPELAQEYRRYIPATLGPELEKAVRTIREDR